MLQYILERAELKDKNGFYSLINTKISPDVGDKIMSLAEQLKLEGKFEIIEQLLAAKVEPVFISQTTGISLSKIRELQKTMVEA